MDDSEPIARRHFEYRETAVTIIAQERFMSLADNSIFDTREVVERFIAFDRLFQMLRGLDQATFARQQDTEVA